MNPVSENKRSPLCHLITDFNSAAQRRIARFDFWGVVSSALLVMILLGFARLLVSR
jgi:hypothetical protein